MVFFRSIIARFQSLFTDPLGFILELLVLLLAMCVSISFHEWAHAFAAYKLGDPTAKNMGRMTLDPTKHIDGLGLVMFALFGIGWAKPVVISSRNLKNFRRDDIIISLAGPVTNVILSFLFYGIYLLVRISFGVTNTIVLDILSTIVRLNAVFAVFNLIPIPPLDGFHIISSLFIRRAFRVVEFLMRYGRYILLVLIISGGVSWLINAVGGGLLSLFYEFWMLFF